MSKKNRHQLACGALALAVIGVAGDACAQAIQGPSSSHSPYVVPAAPGVKTVSLLTVGDSVNNKPNALATSLGYSLNTPYRMVGIPDGLGAYNNGNGTFTILMNQELGATVGAVREHGATGAFVSKWIVNSNPGSADDLEVLHGSDLIKQVNLYNPITGGYVGATGQAAALGRLCSADLADISAYSFGNLGTTERIFMNGEEVGAEGRGFAHIATGPNTGQTYQLPRLGKFSWENSVANPFSQQKTVVVGTDDSTPGQVYVYVGLKQDHGSEIDKAGLTNGNLYGVAVNSIPGPNSVESRDRGLALGTASSLVTSSTFDMVLKGNVSNQTGVAFDADSKARGVTDFLRPEDGHWDALNPRDFYFVTTDRYDQVKDGVGATVGRSRLYRMRFADVTSPESGGQIEMMLDGSEMGFGGVPGPNMMDNMTVFNTPDGKTRMLMQEDPGGQAHNAKIWLYDVDSDTLQVVAQHDSARFGNIGQSAVAPFNNDEESSGIIDARDTLGLGWFLLDVQAHYGIPGELVEGGQLLAMFIPQAFATPVPEPATFAMLGIGALALLGRRRRAIA